MNNEYDGGNRSHSEYLMQLPKKKKITNNLRTEKRQNVWNRSFSTVLPPPVTTPNDQGPCLAINAAGISKKETDGQMEVMLGDTPNQRGCATTANMPVTW